MKSLLLGALYAIRTEHAEYGLRKVQHVLRTKYKINISIVRLSKMLHDNSLMSVSGRRKRSYNRSRINARYDNLLKSTTIKQINQVWVNDITYISRGEQGEYWYLSLVVDAFSRKIMGFYLAENLKTDGVKQCIYNALRNVDDASGIIHHSDRGCQYTSSEYIEILNKHSMQISQTGDGKCYDNARMERVNNTLKTELKCYRLPSDRASAMKQLIQVIHYYNVIRIHQALGYKTPQEVYLSGLKSKSGSETSSNLQHCMTS